MASGEKRRLSELVSSAFFTCIKPFPFFVAADCISDIVHNINRYGKSNFTVF